MCTILRCVIFFISFTVQADIYQWTDDEGNKHFSDKPHQGAKTLQVQAGYSYYQVKKVYDGDTVLLKNGQKIRFLGINTPEVEGRNKTAQAGGEEAKRWLQKQLKNKKIRLERDVEKQDKYGRFLAHIFTEDKQHINLELVKKGYASVNIYPPNLKYTEQLLTAESQANRSRLGLWKYPEYKRKPVSQITQGRFKGWQRVIGKINTIRHTRKYSYLSLSDTFSLKIEKKAQKYFPKLDSYLGKRVEVRGWINQRKGRYSMFLRHSSALQIQE